LLPKIKRAGRARAGAQSGLWWTILAILRASLSLPAGLH
jgi:hypothetical protein